MPFYLKMYLNLLTGRIHVTSDTLREQQISPRNECP
jgi:hypothetical protein